MRADWILLKAAGTPMIRPLPLSSLAIETLFPGEFSMSSTSGMASPTLTQTRDEAWNERETEATPRRAEGKDFRAANMITDGSMLSNVASQEQGV